MKLGPSDQIHIKSWIGGQLEPVGPGPYRIELFATKIQKSKHRPSSLALRHELSNVIPFIPIPINRCENMLACVRFN